MGTLARLAAVLAVFCAGAWGQEAVRSEFQPGQKLHYSFEGEFSYQAGARDADWRNPAYICSYKIHAAFRTQFNSRTATGSLRGEVRFEGPQSSDWHCGDKEIRPIVDHYLKALSGGSVPFTIFPNGEVKFETTPVGEDAKEDPVESDGFNLVIKSVWDSLQTTLAYGVSAPTPAAKPTRAFLYHNDSFEGELQVAGSSVTYAQNTSILGHDYAVLKYRQALAPQAVPNFDEARSNADDFDGVLVMAGETRLNLLFDTAAHTIAFVNRTRKIDNRVDTQYATEDRQELGQYSLAEKSTIRLLPDESADAWLAALRRYELAGLQPQKAVAATSMEDPHSLAAIARASRARQTRLATTEDTLSFPTPRGFQRWSKSYCDGDACFDVSVAVPVGSEAVISDDDTILFSPKSADDLSVALGPAFFAAQHGLTEGEFAAKEARRFLGGATWFTAEPSQIVSITETAIAERGATETNFRAKSRSLKPIVGMLGTVIGPFSRVLHVACFGPVEKAAAIEQACPTVLNSIRIQ